MSLIQKLVAVMKAVDHVEKAGRNQSQNYNYVKASDVARAVRQACIEQGVFITSSVDAEERWTGPTRSGGVMNYCKVAMSFWFHDAAEATGIFLGPYRSMGYGMDTGEKSIYKAQTGALKYALRNSFLIPDESDPENDAGASESDSAETSAPTTSKPPATPQKGKSGAWQTSLTNDTLKCYVCSLVEWEGKFPGSKKFEVRYMAANGTGETGMGGFAKGEFLANLRASVHKNAAFKIEKKDKYTNIKDVLDIFPLEPEIPEYVTDDSEIPF